MGIILIDQGSKSWAISYLMKRNSYLVINRMLHFKLVRNTGVVFSIFRGRNRIITIALVPMVLVLLGYLVLLIKTSSVSSIKLGLSFIVGGSIGNIIDRIRKGYVVDFIYFPLKKWPIFNIADFYILGGTMIIIYIIILGDVPEVL